MTTPPPQGGPGPYRSDAHPTREYPAPEYPTQQYPAQPYSAQAYPAQPAPAPVYAGAPGGEPDWTVLADRYEANGRRRRALAVVGGVLAVCLVGGATALAWSTTKPGASRAASGTAPSGTPVASASAGATTSALPATPRPGTPPALRPAALFAPTLRLGGRTWTRVATDVQSLCWKSTAGGLGNVLAAHRCRQLLRATYSSGKDSVTVGVAALQDARAAAGTVAQFQGRLAPLWHGADTAFCRKSACALTHAAMGRFVYLTVAGPNSGAAGDKDRASVTAGHAAASAVLTRLATAR